MPWREVEWYTEQPEEICWSDDRVNLHKIPEGKTGVDMLIAGQVDAYINPHPPVEIFSNENVRHLFDDSPLECHHYYQIHGNYPIMHLLVLGNDLVEECPKLPVSLISMWDDAKEQAGKSCLDYNYTMMPFGHFSFEKYIAEFGKNIWFSGLDANRRGLERFIIYMKDQLLISESFPIEKLFHPSVHGT